MRLRPLCFALLILSALPMTDGPVKAYRCGPLPTCAPPMVTVCGPPIVSLAPCCQPSALFPPPPPIDAPVIAFPEPMPCEAYSAPIPLPAPPPLVVPSSAAPLPVRPPRAPLPSRARQPACPPIGITVSPTQLYGGLGIN